jgi:F-type H+-transporting ATPase subunit beta
MATSNGVVVGKVVQVAGPAVDCEFPEGQIPVIYTAIRITSEGFDVPDPIDIICEAQQHIGEGRVRTIALQPTEGLVRGMQAISLGRPVEVPVGPETLGRVLNVIGQPVDEMGPVNAKKTYPIHRPAPPSMSSRRVSKCSRPASRSSICIEPYLRGGKIGSVRRRGRGQDRHHSGTDQQPGDEARRRFGVRRRGRAHQGRQRSLARIQESGVIDPTITPNLSAPLIYGQMTEPPGARLRVGPDRPNGGRVFPR